MERSAYLPGKRFKPNYGVGIQATDARIEHIQLANTIVEAVATARRLHLIHQGKALVWKLRTDKKIYRIDLDGRWYWLSDAPATRKARAAGGGQ